MFLLRFERFINLLLLISVFEMGVGCVPKSKDDTVEVNTSGIFEPVTFEVIGGEDLGEVLTGGDPVFAILRVKNNSSYPLTEMDLTLDFGTSSANMSFALSESGLDAFPGSGGTCNAVTRKLASNESCTMVIAYNPQRNGEFTQNVTFSYKNLVKKESIKKELKVLSGDEASLILLDPYTLEGISSTFNYGILEQTVPEVRKQVLMVENRGGLSARNLELSWEAPPPDQAFALESHNCPQILKAFKSCTAVVSYVPLNVLESDPAASYVQRLRFNYIRDGKVKTKDLKTTFSFESTKIQAQMDTNLGVVEFDPDIVVGNRTDKFIRITNKGYREGIPLKFIIKNDLDQIVSICKKAASGIVLDCFQNDEITPSTLEISPFKFEDTSSCLEREVRGVVNGVAGENCDFRAIFQPSVTYLTNRNFSGWTISVEYDSQWKGNVTIITEKLFDISANSLAAARLQWEFFGLNNVQVNDQDATLAGGFYDLGRVALISDAAYYSTFEIRVRNVGSVPAVIQARYDGQATPQPIPTSTANIMSVSDSPLPTYWNNVANNCNTIDPGQLCAITGRFTPLSYAVLPDSEDIQHRLFLDVNPLNPPGYDRFKQFFMTYADGATFEDDDSAREDREIEARVTGILVTKGFLVWEGDPAQIGDLGSHSVKDTATKQFVLKNVGTGSIPYIKLHDSNHLRFPPSISYSYYQTFYPIAQAPPVGVDKDCLNVVDYEIANYADFLSDPDIFPLSPPDVLAPGEKCSFTVEGSKKIYDSIDSEGYATVLEDKTRYFHMSQNNTLSLWQLENGMSNNSFSVNYFDGDIGLGLAPPYQDNFGYYLGIPNVTVSMNFNSVSSIFIDAPLPIESAIYYRPALTYPPVPGANASFPDHFNGYSVPETWFLNDLSTSAPASHQSLSSTHVASLVNSTYDYTYHMGTFPSDGSTYAGSFNLVVDGGVNLTVRNLTGDAEIALASTHPSVPYNMWMTEVMRFEFTPSVGANGVFEKILTLTYDNGFETVNRTVRILAEAINVFPDLQLDTQEFSVVLVGATPMETLDGPQELNVDLNFMQPDAVYENTFFAVKGSAVYAKKRFTLTNTSGSNIDNLYIMLKGTVNAATFNNTTANYWVENEANCNSIAAAADCTFDIVFKPGVAAPNTDLVILVLTYMVAPNQAISKMVNLRFNAGSPADLSVQGISTISVFDNADSLIKPSYEISFGYVSDVNHIRVNAYPHTEAHPTTFTIVNSSALKATFLKMLGDPPYNTQLVEPVEIYNSGGRRVTATIPCFIGDDDESITPYHDEQGFNASTLTPCQVNFEYTADETYLGDEIVKEDNLFSLQFYDNKWSSFNQLYFHFVGFIEPNFSTNAGGYYNVTAISDGSATFSWGAFTPNNADWGTITGYRIYSSTIGNSLSELYSTGASFVDVPNSTFTVNYLALIPGRYYYYKVATRRTIGPKTYLSIDPAMPTLKLVIPPIGSTFNYSLGALIDKGYINSPGTRSENISTCAAERYTLFDGGSTVQRFKQLINTDIWTYIQSDPDSTNYLTYSNYMAPAYPHWLADSPTDIEPIFTPWGGFSSANTLQVVSPASMFYQKSCSDSSCNNLYKVVGGDGVDYFYDGSAYVEANMIAFPRCWAPY